MEAKQTHSTKIKPIPQMSLVPLTPVLGGYSASSTDRLATTRSHAFLPYSMILDVFNPDFANLPALYFPTRQLHAGSFPRIVHQRANREGKCRSIRWVGRVFV